MARTLSCDGGVSLQTGFHILTLIQAPPLMHVLDGDWIVESDELRPSEKACYLLTL